MTEKSSISQKQLKLSLVLPCYNERGLLAKVVERILKVDYRGFDLELLVIDDASTDGSDECAKMLAERHPEIVLRRHVKNLGKGSALRTGFSIATGDYIGIQDVDFEYDPGDYVKMLSQMCETGAKVAFGSRYWTGKRNPGETLLHRLTNRFLTAMSNLFSGLRLHDMETCYKLFDRRVLARLLPLLREERFGCEPEMVAKVAKLGRKMGFTVCECPVSYAPRGVDAGKKIGWKDGFRALYCILKYNLPGFDSSCKKCLCGPKVLCGTI